jgi:hypothetical protein
MGRHKLLPDRKQYEKEHYQNVLLPRRRKTRQQEREEDKHLLSRFFDIHSFL